MNMKRLADASLLQLLLLCITLQWGCGEKTVDGVSLSGEISGMGDDTLYIYGMDRYFDRVDTLFVTKGTFSDTLSVDTIVTAWLQFADGTELPLCMNHGDKIHIKGSAAELSTLEITGNAPNELLTAFRKDIGGMVLPSDKVLEEKAEAFISANPSSLACIHLLDRYFVRKPNPNIQRIKQLSSRLSGEVRDRPYMTELMKRIENNEKVEKGKPLPTFQSPDAEGKQISRSDFSKKYVLVHFWASWDKTSRDSNYVWKRLYKEEKKSEDFAIWGVSLDINKQAWLNAVKADTLEWQQTCDLAAWESDAVQRAAVRSLPANLLFDPRGRIAGINVTSDEVRKILKDNRK